MSEEIAVTDAVSEPPPLPPSPLEKLNDFSDKLSPMLVKELRQGLRTHTFIILFLVLQGFLALILLTTAAADTNSGGFVSGVIFSFFGLAVLVVQPLRGMSAISSELKSDTIDLMALTKLSAWRIVIGKWSSLVSQTALIFCAIIPYLILRYFFGGMQLFAELFLLCTMFAFSAALTALTVGLSACTLALVRLLPLLGALFLVFPIFLIGFSERELGQFLELFAPSTLDHWLTLLGIYTITAYVGYFFLELATTAIAPASQNRATRKRLIGFVVILGTFFCLASVDAEAAWIVASILIAMMTIDLFTESTDYPSIVLQPFQRFGGASRAFARILAPGWASGFLFFLLLWALLFIFPFINEDALSPYSNTWVFLAFLFGALNFNLLIVNLLRKKFENRFVPYLVITVTLCGLMPLFAMLESISSGDSILMVFCWIPYSFPFVEQELEQSTLWVIAGLYALLNLLFAIAELRKMGALEKSHSAPAAETPETTPAP